MDNSVVSRSGSYRSQGNLNVADTGAANRMHWTVEDVQSCIADAPVVVFAKGTREHPRCGFSEQLFIEMERTGQPYRVVDVCEDPSVVPALRAFDGLQNLPAVYVNGQLVAGCDDRLGQLLTSGGLADRVKQAQKSGF